MSGGRGPSSFSEGRSSGGRGKEVDVTVVDMCQLIGGMKDNMAQYWRDAHTKSTGYLQHIIYPR